MINSLKTNTLKYLLACLSVCSLPNPAFAETIQAKVPQERTIQVTGDAEVRVVPDEAIIAMSVEARDKVLLTGKQKADSSVSAALELFKKLEIKPEHIQTDFIEVFPEFVSCDNRDKMAGTCDPTKVDYYNIKKGLLIRLKDLSKFEPVISGSLQNGVSNIENVTFVTTAIKKYRDQARDRAVKAAKEKAEAVAGALGQKVGKPLSISLNNNSSYAGYYGQRRGRGYNDTPMMQNAVSNIGGGESASEGSESSTSLGQIKVNAQVNVTFEIE